MLACPLCEALFTRYELALEYDYPSLAKLLRRSIRKHGRTDHAFRRTLNASMYFSVPIETYRTWMQQELNGHQPAALVTAPRGQETL